MSLVCVIHHYSIHCYDNFVHLLGDDLVFAEISVVSILMKGTKVQTLGGRAVAGAWLVAWAIMAMGAIINTHAHR